MTFEGDNNVLLQQVSKELVKEYSSGLKKGKFPERLSYLNDPSFKEPLNFSDVTCPKFQIKLFKKRENDAILRVLKAIENFKSQGMVGEEAWNESCDVASQCGRAYIVR
jgi:acyl-CoA oxidase